MEDKNFEELRNQFAILKEQLDKQDIINDRLLRETMKVKNKDISRVKHIGYVLAVICLIVYPTLYLNHIWSLAFAIVTCVMMVFCIAATYYIHRPVEKLNFMKDDFATVARVMAKFKKQNNDWLHYVTPALITPWLIWACYEFAWKYAPAGSNPWILTFPLLIGAAIGALIGYRLHRKTVDAAQDIIDEIKTEIEELEDEH